MTTLMSTLPTFSTSRMHFSHIDTMNVAEKVIANRMAAPFRFFDLAMELRNAIYANLSLSDPPRHLSSIFSLDRDDRIVIASNYCAPNLRLVSRQFKQEYEEETSRHAQCDINIQDVLWGGATGYTALFHEDFTSVYLAPRVRSVTLHLTIGYVEFERECLLNVLNCLC